MVSHIQYVLPRIVSGRTLALLTLHYSTIPFAIPVDRKAFVVFSVVPMAIVQSFINSNWQLLSNKHTLNVCHNQTLLYYSFYILTVWLVQSYSKSLKAIQIGAFQVGHVGNSDLKSNQSRFAVWFVQPSLFWTESSLLIRNLPLT